MIRRIDHLAPPDRGRQGVLRLLGRFGGLLRFLRRFLRRLDARLWKWTGRRLAWSRLAGSGLLLLGTVLFLVLLAALLLRALY